MYEVCTGMYVSGKTPYRQAIYITLLGNGLMDAIVWSILLKSVFRDHLQSSVIIFYLYKREF